MPWSSQPSTRCSGQANWGTDPHRKPDLLDNSPVQLQADHDIELESPCTDEWEKRPWALHSLHQEPSSSMVEEGKGGEQDGHSANSEQWPFLMLSFCSLLNSQAGPSGELAVFSCHHSLQKEFAL